MWAGPLATLVHQLLEYPIVHFTFPFHWPLFQSFHDFTRHRVDRITNTNHFPRSVACSSMKVSVS